MERCHDTASVPGAEFSGGIVTLGAQKAGGFVLIASLWLVAGLGLLAAYIDGLASKNVEQAIAAKDTLSIKLDLLSTEATLLYLLSSNRVNHRGFILDERQRFSQQYPEELPNSGDGELWVTDQAYAGRGSTVFSVQDETGLVSINMPATQHFSTLLEFAGINRNDAAGLIARIIDYIDSNSELSLNGAERFDYERTGQPPPANWLFSTPLEARYVLGFDEYVSPAQWNRIRPLLTTRPQVGYNFNTMAPDLLGAMLDLDQAAVDALTESRRARPIRSVRQLRTLTTRPLTMDPESIVSMPGRAFRISLWQSGGRNRQLLGIRLTPFGDHAPWRKDYQYSEQIPQHGATVPRKAETALF
jgi:hypothetical protein